MQTAFFQRLEDLWKVARRARHLNPLVGRVLREPQHRFAIQVHRGIAGGAVETAGVELGDVGDELRGARPLLGGSESGRQILIRQTRQRVALHEEVLAGAGLLSLYHTRIRRSYLRRGASSGNSTSSG